MKRLFTVGVAIVSLCWLLYLAAGRWLASLAAKVAGSAIVKLGQGKIFSPSEFVLHRLFEICCLSTSLLLLLVPIVVILEWHKRQFPTSRLAWVVPAVLLICYVSVTLWIAEQTVLFWGLMWEGDRTQNLTRFYLKLLLARENTSPLKVVLVGNSQTRAQIDEDILNSKLSPAITTTELHYPGSKGYDLYLLQPIVSKAAPNWIICYVTEAYFCGGSNTEVQPNFFRPNDIPDLLRRDGLHFVPWENVLSGGIGNVVQLFRLREVFAQRIYGPQTGQLKQSQYNANLESNLRQRAHRAAADYRVNDEIQFQERAFEDFARRCQKSGQRLIILAGQMNPIFEDELDPRIRPLMMSFLSQVAAHFPNVTLIDSLPPQSESDYEDLTHVTRPAQERFSQYLANWMERESATQPPN